MPNLVKWDNCCGCAACASKCHRQAISMVPNEEGFLHPMIDVDKCVECKACEEVCPGLAPAYNNHEAPRAFIAQHKNDAIRYQSTSGGAFSAIAEVIIRRGGVVFGAIMTDDLRVVHRAVDSLDGLAMFRNSKYVQSEIGNCFLLAKQLLIQGREVCFSGTPCQINGLIKFLGNDYKNLITVDVVCKSVPSPLVFKKYVEYSKAKEGEISDVVFRDKKRGFFYCTMAHYKSHEDRTDAKDVYRRGSESDEWLRLFLSGRISRHSCFNCQFQTKQRVADFTLGDIWETGNSELDDNKGSTLVHVWSDKGMNLFDLVKNNVKWVDYPIEQSRGAERTSIISLPPGREMVFKDVNNLNAKAFFAKYAPYSFKVRMKELGRKTIWRLQLHNAIRHIKHSFIHR